MTNAVFRGSRQPQYQQFSRSSSPTSGIVETHEWAGIGPVEMAGYENSYRMAGWKVDYRNRFGTLTLVASGNITAPAGTTPLYNTIDTWEIASSRTCKSVLENPLVVAGVVDNASLIILRSFLRGEFTYEEAETGLTGDAYGSALLIELNKGLETFYDTTYILRHTTNVDNRWAQNVADQNVNGIYTTAQLLSETQSTSDWIFPLPGRLAYKISALASDFIARYGTHAERQWGWLKSASSEGTSANNRVNITTDYEFGEISTLLYGYAS